jgi:nitroreductase
MLSSENHQILLNLIGFRRSVRKFSDKPIEKEKLDLILEAGRLAPSSSNSQPWHFIVVKNKEIIKKLVEAVPLGIRPNLWFANAPVIIVFVAKPHLIEHKLAKILASDYHRIDTAIAIDHMVLMATALGIGSCWVGWFDQKKVRKILNIPKKADVVMLLPLGYPQEQNTEEGMGGIKQRPRKKLEEIVSYDKYE